MKCLILLAGVVLLSGAAFCRADSGVPTTQPAPTVEVSPYYPASGDYTSVLVLPFTPTSGASDWMGKGIQDDLATELVRQSRLNVLTPSDAPAVADADAALKLGRAKGASLVAFGSFQIVDSDVRITGHLIESSTGRSVAALSATGPRRDLFHMEDQLAAQALDGLPPTSVRVGYGQYASNATPATAEAPATSAYASQPYDQGGYTVTAVPETTPSYVQSGSPYTYDYVYPPYATAAYPYGYDYDDYGSPFWGGGFIVIDGNGEHHHHWSGGRGSDGVGVSAGTGLTFGGGATFGRGFSAGATTPSTGFAVHTPGGFGFQNTFGGFRTFGGGARSFGGGGHR